MPMDIKKLREVGTDVVGTKPKSEIQSKVLGILKVNTKNGEAVTQKEIAAILTKKMGREIKPQQARSALMSLRKKDKVVRRQLTEPDENGNTVFWYSK